MEDTGSTVQRKIQMERGIRENWIIDRKVVRRRLRENGVARRDNGVFQRDARRCEAVIVSAIILMIMAVTPLRAQTGGYDPRTWIFEEEANVLLAPGDTMSPENPGSADRHREPIPKRVVNYSGSEPTGTIIVNTTAKRLDLVLGGGKAMRYSVGVGREGLSWSGRDRVSAKKHWPDWRPPAEMRAREKLKGRSLPAFVPGGHNNPLGARALYIGSTLYRIHGTNQPWTVGTATSSGCIRLTNEDIVDLYERVPVGVGVIVEN